MAETPPESVSIHYEERPNKPTLSMTGAQGGITVDGRNVVAHLYSEWGMIPTIEQIPIESGKAGAPKTIRRGDVNREIQASLVMSPEAAMEFGRWLIGKALSAYDRRDQVDRPMPDKVEGDS